MTWEALDAIVDQLRGAGIAVDAVAEP